MGADETRFPWRAITEKISYTAAVSALGPRTPRDFTAQIIFIRMPFIFRDIAFSKLLTIRAAPRVRISRRKIIRPRALRGKRRARRDLFAEETFLPSVSFEYNGRALTLRQQQFYAKLDPPDNSKRNSSANLRLPRSCCRVTAG